MKSGGFHMQIASFAYEIRQISYVKYYNAYNFFFDVNQIRNSLALGSPRLSL